MKYNQMGQRNPLEQLYKLIEQLLWKDNTKASNSTLNSNMEKKN